MEAPAKFVLDPDNPLSDKAYADFCAANPDLWLERLAQGEIIIVPLPGAESLFRELDVATQLSQ